MGSFACRTRTVQGEADAVQGETGKCTGLDAAGQGSKHPYTGCGDNVGIHHLPAGGSQQPAKTHRPRGTRGGGRDLVRRMSQYERRRQGNACPGGVDTAPARVAPSTGKGALGKWRASRQATIGVGRRPSLDVKLRRCRAGGITTQLRGVCRRVLEPRAVWEGPPGKAAAANRTREIRLSGMRGGPGET